MRYIFHNFINTLRRYKVSSLLNVVGMAVAFGAFYVIMTQVSWDFGYNQRLKDADRTFVISLPSNYSPGKYNTFICRPLGEELVNGAAEAECGGMFDSYSGDAELCWTRKDEVVRKLHLTSKEYSAGGIRALNFEAAEGSFDELSKPRTLAVSEAFARENGLGIGDRISWSDPEGEADAMEIVALFRDFQENSDLACVKAITDIGDGYIDSRNEWSFQYAVRLHDASEKESFEKNSDKVLREYVMKVYGIDESSSAEDIAELNEALNGFNVKLVSLKDIYYTKILDGRPGESGNLTTDITLLAVAILIILIALINFINFFFALVPSRLRSVNTYKIFGVSRTSLVFNFIGESVGLVLISLALAALLVYAFASSPLAEILSSPVSIGGNVPVVALTVAVAVTAAIGGSVYPALYITSFQPALVLKGSFGGSAAGRRLRNILIGFQFTISIALIVCSSFIRLQHSYMMNYDMGFDKSNLLTGNIPYGLCWYGEQNRAFEDKLRSNPQIEDITWADGRIVSTSRMGWGHAYKGGSINFQCYPVAYNFLRFMGIEIVEGRDFSESDEVSESSSMIFNTQAQKEFDIDLETPGPGHQDNTQVVGICRDFNFKPLQYGSAPFAFYVFGKHSWRSGLRHIYIRTAPGANPGEVIRFVNNTVAEMRPDIDPETYGVDFFDRELGEQYRQENQLAQLIGLFTLIAIVISLMGVFGLVLFETQHRSREIAIRRVHGASVGDILKMFNLKFIAIVLVSFAVAAPASWLIVRFYFRGFAYHTPIFRWVFAAALLAVLVITVLIVTLRSRRAATANPVDYLKNE